LASQERRRRMHAATREQILEAALSIAHTEGWQGVTMRKIGDRIEYTHAAIYAYFSTKEELLLALAQGGNQQLYSELEAARIAAPEPREALISLAAAYWRFARQHPELYQVIHGLGGLPLRHPNTEADERRVAEPVVAVIVALLGDIDDVEVKVALLWSTIHGLITLTMAGRFTEAEAERIIQQMLQDTLIAWGIRPLN
jgi:AcrR family transcriptional regulator